MRAKAEIVWMPLSESAAKADADALRGLTENDRVLGAVLAVLARLHARRLLESEGAAREDAPRLLDEARGVRAAIREIVEATRGGGGDGRRGHA